MAEIRKCRGNTQVGDFAGKHLIVLDQDEYDMLIYVLNTAVSDYGTDDLIELRDSLEIY